MEPIVIFILENCKTEVQALFVHNLNLLFIFIFNCMDRFVFTDRVDFDKITF